MKGDHEGCGNIKGLYGPYRRFDILDDIVINQDCCKSSYQISLTAVFYQVLSEKSAF